MISDDIAKQLHDRFSQGETLSTKEQRQLNGWYARQDLVESKAIQAASKEKSIPLLHEQVDTALQQLTTVTKHIQQAAKENESLRREIATLRRQLARQLGMQPA